uniref:Uncharacterized protein n=1 Tax=Cannabis sativa TaxID=3483 RepID=A0A803PEM2_CANSA
MNQAKIKKVKSGVGSTSKSWSLNDPELQRKKRVAGYKAYVVEGKMKGSFRKSFKWIKRIKGKPEGSFGNALSHLSGLVVLDMSSRYGLLKEKRFASAEPRYVPRRTRLGGLGPL